MQTKVQKWGNSLALRIPKAFASDAQLENNSLVDISLTEGQIVIKPIEKSVWTIDELLSAIDESNIHREVDTGKAEGNEIW
jgi:antitoxin MazE